MKTTIVEDTLGDGTTRVYLIVETKGCRRSSVAILCKDKSAAKEMRNAILTNADPHALKD